MATEAAANGGSAIANGGSATGNGVMRLRGRDRGERRLRTTEVGQVATTM
ncbi:hypothetical protein SESBI_40154 [Sesbania bispinosa]|nr:hypothetical protein SESBI_40154 [Sesbania bispinosa]